MRSNFIVVAPPVLGNYLDLQAVAEPLQRQAFHFELGIETLIGSILPRLYWLTQHGLQSFIPNPFQQPKTYEFRAVVAGEYSSNSVRHFSC